ncbi:hypothetical protein [Streptomyces rubiginosohelvolus]|uniref:Uncharacterized protein n=1 Tax=Streptomyces rubiginosohelvolus TaxID=67362 RepID=A0ABW6F3Q3_9ACTN
MSLQRPSSSGWCQLLDGITIFDSNGQRQPDCPNPPVARIAHHHGGTTMLCREDLDRWLDNADDDAGMEPAGLHLLPVRQ